MNMVANTDATESGAEAGEDSSYEQEVLSWGGAQPWKGRPRLSHRAAFEPADVKTDGRGNILSMPPLERKPCFGRPETFFRQGETIRAITLKGRRINSRKHQCGQCKVRAACAKVCRERTSSDPAVLAALTAWYQDTKTRNDGRRVYTEESGGLWYAFLKVLAERGPFHNANDGYLRDLEARNTEIRRERWASAKRRQRQADRRRRAAEHLPPTPEFIEFASNERELRRISLLAVAGNATMPPSISKIPASHAERTASLTANLWYVRTVQQAMGHERKPGSLARLMVDEDLGEGLAYPSLKARIRNDLTRIEVLEAQGVWEKFDPDSYPGRSDKDSEADLEAVTDIGAKQAAASFEL